MTLKSTFALILISLTLSACSNQAIYNTLQQNQRNACLKEPPVLYEECMERASQSYQDYRRERDEMLQD